MINTVCINFTSRVREDKELSEPVKKILRIIIKPRIEIGKFYIARHI